MSRGEDEARLRVPMEFRRYARPFPQVEGAASSYPDAAAISFGDAVWTYARLVERCRALSTELAAVEVRQGDIVTVSGFPSPGLVAAALAVLACDATLFLLDPLVPPRRSQQLLEHAGSRVVVHVGAPAPAATYPSGHVILRIDALTGLLEESAKLRRHLRQPSVEPDAAYLVFTSGTTEGPRAVVGSANGLMHFVDWQRRTFSVGPGDRVAQVTSTSFDVFYREMLLPLTSGATLCIPRHLTNRTPTAIMQWLRQQEVTLIHVVPSLVEHWLRAPTDDVVQSTRHAFFAGEQLLGQLVRQFAERFPNAQVVNLYGPTETTLAKCFYAVPTDPPDGVLPVGRPIPGSEVYLLTTTGDLSESSSIGEIAIRTPYRSLGYLHSGTAGWARSLINPFRTDVADLLYATGDMGKWDVAQDLVVTGRLDEELKIEGVRVAPAELEALIRACPSVSQAAVVSFVSGGSTRLAAFLVPAEPEPSDFVDGVQACLANYVRTVVMPQVWEVLDDLPRLTTGKVDRRALALRAAARVQDPASTQRHVGPRDDVELALLTIAREASGLVDIGVRDDLLAVGFDSLALVAFATEIAEQFAVELPLAALAAGCSLEEVARLLRKDRTRWTTSDVLSFRHSDAGPTVVFLPSFTGTAVIYQHVADQVSEGVSVIGLQQEPAGARASSVQALAEHYAAQIAAFAEGRLVVLGGFSFGGLLAVETARALCARGIELGRVLIVNPPLTQTSRPLLNLATFARTLALDLVGREIDFSTSLVEGLSDEEQLTYVRDLLAREDVLPALATSDYVRELGDVFADNVRAAQTYEFPRFDLPTWVLAPANVDKGWLPNRESGIWPSPDASLGAYAILVADSLNRILTEVTGHARFGEWNGIR